MFPLKTRSENFTNSLSPLWRSLSLSLLESPLRLSLLPLHYLYLHHLTRTLIWVHSHPRRKASPSNPKANHDSRNSMTESRRLKIKFRRWKGTLISVRKRSVTRSNLLSSLISTISSPLSTRMPRNRSYYWPKRKSSQLPTPLAWPPSTRRCRLLAGTLANLLMRSQRLFRMPRRSLKGMMLFRRKFCG